MLKFGRSEDGKQVTIEGGGSFSINGYALTAVIVLVVASIVYLVI